MGNTAAVASGVKNQGDSESKELYRLVNLKGGGELVECAKRAGWTKNYSELDEKIKSEVSKFLYNNGEGKMIPMVKLIKARSKERQKSKIKIGRKKKQKERELADADGNGLDNKADKEFREVCWHLNKRGTVGESILHLCLLKSSAIHANLTKKLLHHFPKLINDIYVSEEYYGENALHMAIVIEDPSMVKFLLDKGADYHQRCCGNFFTPDDQKDSRTDSLDHEWVDVCQKTNYEGHVYFGEYPLSFAACLGQEESVRLLIAKGADPNRQDSNGNTVMHMLIIADDKKKQLEGEYTSKKDMFDILYDLNGRIDIKNRQGLTPLTLAARLARKEMYEHILEKIRKIYWIYGNVMCAGYPLSGIDTISPTGELDQFSVLNLVVYGESAGHLDMMDGLIVNLLKEKWKVFAKYRFYRRFALFIIYFLLSVAVFILRPGTDKCPTITQVNSTNGIVQNVTEFDNGYLLKACSTADKVRFCLEILVLLGAIAYVFLAMKEIFHQGFTVFFTTLRGTPTKAMFLMSCVFVVLMLPGRAAEAYKYEDVMAIFAVLLAAPYFLFFCRGFRILGPFIIMIYKMIMGDLRRFFVIYIVFIIGFSQAFYLLHLDTSCDKAVSPCVFSDPVDAIIGSFSMSVGGFDDIVGQFKTTKYEILANIMFILYMILVTLLLVNMLIAMMGNTYKLVAETQKEWFRQWAKIVLVVEQSVTTKERLKYQMHYSQPIAAEQSVTTKEKLKYQMQYSQPAPESHRAFPVRWYQSEREREGHRIARERERQKQKEKMSQYHWKKMQKTAIFSKMIRQKGARKETNI